MIGTLKTLFFQGLEKTARIRRGVGLTSLFQAASGGAEGDFYDVS